MGKTKYIESPQAMWKYFENYKKSIKDNPILVKDWVGKDADEVHKPKERPLTFIGFQNYLDDIGIINVVEQYFENRDDRYSEYVGICSRIKRNIQQDQIEGGMVNIYNPSITQRLNGLTDNLDLTTKGKEIQTQAPNIKVTIVNPKDDEE